MTGLSDNCPWQFFSCEYLFDLIVISLPHLPQFILSFCVCLLGLGFSSSLGASFGCSFVSRMLREASAEASSIISLLVSTTGSGSCFASSIVSGIGVASSTASFFKSTF